VLRDPLGRRLTTLFHRSGVYTPTATVAGLDRSDATRRAWWRSAVFPALIAMLLAFAATTVVLRSGDDDGSAAPAAATETVAPARSDVATVERLVQDELQLRLDDPDVPGLPLTVTGVSCTAPVRGQARCAARFVDQGGRPPVRIAVSFPRGRMVWRVVR
jgi:hypothetical protein